MLHMGSPRCEHDASPMAASHGHKRSAQLIQSRQPFARSSCCHSCCCCLAVTLPQQASPNNHQPLSPPVAALHFLLAHV